MCGTLSLSERDAIMRRVRKCATRAKSAFGEGRWNRYEYWLAELQEAWHSLPECMRDTTTPPPEEALRACESYERQKLEAERIEMGGI
jgi:hypothetical protein